MATGGGGKETEFPPHGRWEINMRTARGKSRTSEETKTNTKKNHAKKKRRIEKSRKTKQGRGYKTKKTHGY